MHSPAVRRFIVALAGVVCLSSAPAALAQTAPCSTANPAANTSGSGVDWTSDQAIQTAFSGARAAEGCTVPLVLPANYDALTPPQQTLWLVNNEREVRGLGDLTLDTTVMSQIALNHSREMAQYNYFEHSSPINQVGDASVNLPRNVVNPVFANDFFGENIAAGQRQVAAAVFSFMYNDGDQGWGHRAAILQGAFTWLGVGIVQNAPTSQWGSYYTLDFGQIHAGYAPPAAADATPPATGQVSYANGTATVMGVAASSKNANSQGANALTAGITGVVFYTNAVADNNETYNTVVATQTPPGSGTWTATIAVNPGDVLHAVAVDGSGNFTDTTLAAAPQATTAQATTTMRAPAASNVVAPQPTATVAPARATTPTGSKVPQR